jgi:hypothetical protein
MIFSLALVTTVFACANLEGNTKAQSIWAEYSRKFVSAPLPRGFFLCLGRSYFAELKHGSQMQSALDRRNRRIILRQNSESLLRHELAHLYLDITWMILPYSVSEPLARAIAFSNPCELRRRESDDDDSLRQRWSMRKSLTECEMQQLFSDVVSASPAVRNTLPLR